MKALILFLLLLPSLVFGARNQYFDADNYNFGGTGFITKTELYYLQGLNGNAQSVIDAKVSNTAYNATSWNGVSTIAPSKDAVRDQIELVLTSLSASISDVAYNASSWDAVTTIAPSKNAVRDQVEVLVAVDATKAPLASPAFTGVPTAPTASQGNNSTQLATTAYTDTGLATKQGTLTNSAGLRTSLSDETGTGLAVFGTSPNITTPTGIVKGDVGLGNVDNTSDANKPVSTATQTALNAKLSTTGNESASGVKNFTGKTVASSTTNGFHPCPSMTDTQMLAIASPSDGDCVHNTTLMNWMVYKSTGSIWEEMGGGGGISNWVTATVYVAGDVVIESYKIYQCLTGHTSGTFATDLAASKWIEISKSISAKGQNTSAVTMEEFQVPNNLLTETATGKYLNETGNTNILANPSFEHTTFSTSWTLTSGSSAQELTKVINGKASYKATLTAQTLNLCQSSTLYASQFAGSTQGIITARVNTTVNGIYVCSQNAGTTNYSNCAPFNNSGTWNFAKVPVSLGATSNGVCFVSGTIAAGVVTPSAVTGDVYFENVFLGASDISDTQPLIGKKTSFTTTVGLTGGTTTFPGKWWQVGNRIEVEIDAIFTSVFTGGTPTFTLPPGFTIDTSSFPIAPATAVNKLGDAELYDISVEVYKGQVLYNNTTSVLVRPFQTIGGSTYLVASTNITPTVPFTWVNNDQIRLRFGVPVLELAGSTSTATYSAQNSDTGWAPCGHTTSDFVGFGTVSNIETQCRRQGTNLQMKGNFTLGSVTATEARLNLKLFGTALTSADTSIIPTIQNAGFMSKSNSISDTFIALTEPSKAYITFGQQASGGLTKRNGDALGVSTQVFSMGVINIPIAGWETPYVIVGSFAARPSVRAYASSTSISSSLATIVFTTEGRDNFNAFSAGVFTCPMSGQYQVNAALAIAGTFALNSLNILEIQKSGVAVTNVSKYSGGIVTNETIQVSDLIDCNLGETIRIQASSGATGPSLVSSNTKNFLSIIKVGLE